MSRAEICIIVWMLVLGFVGATATATATATAAIPVPEPEYRCDFSPTSPNNMSMDINGTGVIGPFDSQHPWTFWNQNGDASYIQTDDFVNIDFFPSLSMHMVVYLCENHGNQWLMWAQDILGRKSLVTMEFNNMTSSKFVDARGSGSGSGSGSSLDDSDDVVSMFAYDEGIEARNDTSPLPTNKWMSLLMVVDRRTDPGLDPPSLYYYLDGELHAQDSKDHNIIWDQKAAQFSLLLNTRGAVSLFELYDVPLTGEQARSLAETHINQNTELVMAREY